MKTNVRNLILGAMLMAGMLVSSNAYAMGRNARNVSHHRMEIANRNHGGMNKKHDRIAPKHDNKSPMRDKKNDRNFSHNAPAPNHHPGPAPKHHPGPAPKPHPAPAPHHAGHGPHHPPMPPRPHHPVMPPHWHPYHGAPVIDAVLGLAWGTTINYAMDYCNNHGYVVNYYTNDAVCLNNVLELSYSWPQAYLTYSNGHLAGAQYIYAQSCYDQSRYHSLYNTLSGMYGSPVYSNCNGKYMEQSWYGGDSRGWVTLELASQGGKYVTSLTYGC